MRSQYGIGVEAADARGCVEQSDVICTCTTSPVPLFQGEWIRPGTHLNLIGAFQPHTREVDSAAVRRARVFVDTQEGAMAGAGEILIPLQNGEIRAEHVVGDLHELVSGNKPGRTARDDITVFKSVGCALEDLVTARLVVQKVQRANPTGASLADIR
jgi:ornithine cyclodeaminase